MGQPESTPVPDDKIVAVARPAPLVQRRGRGGWGHVDIVVDPTDDESQHEPAKPSPPKVGRHGSRPKRLDDDEDYVEKRARRQPRTSAAKKRKTKASQDEDTQEGANVETTKLEPLDHPNVLPIENVGAADSLDGASKDDLAEPS